MTKREKRIFFIAREISFLSDYNGARVGAVVCEGKRIVSTACNSKKTRPLQKRYNIYRHFDDNRNAIPRQHAEIAALSPLIGKEIDWNKVSIFIYRELRNGIRGCSYPCAACHKLIEDLGIKHIYYIDKNGKFIEERIL